MFSINGHCFSTINKFWIGWNRSEHHHASVPQEAPGRLEYTNTVICLLLELGTSIPHWVPELLSSNLLPSWGSTDKSKCHKAFPPLLITLFLVKHSLVRYKAMSVQSASKVGSKRFCLFLHVLVDKWGFGAAHSAIFLISFCKFIFKDLKSCNVARLNVTTLICVPF